MCPSSELWSEQKNHIKEKKKADDENKQHLFHNSIRVLSTLNRQQSTILVLRCKAGVVNDLGTDRLAFVSCLQARM